MLDKKFWRKHRVIIKFVGLVFALSAIIIMIFYFTAPDKNVEEISWQQLTKFVDNFLEMNLFLF